MACLTIGQYIVYNPKKKMSHTALKTRHSKEREPPFPIYIGNNVHAATRSKKLIQKLCHMGICISYDRILEDWIGTSSCERFEDNGVVSPAYLRKGLFTVGALDNLDHNPSSNTSLSSFQMPTNTEPGESQPPITIPPSGDLIKCSCKGDCKNCKCGKANLDCSLLCKYKCNLQV